MCGTGTVPFSAQDILKFFIIAGSIWKPSAGEEEGEGETAADQSSAVGPTVVHHLYHIQIIVT